LPTSSPLSVTSAHRAAVKLDPNRQRVRCTFANGTLFPDQRAAVDRFAAIAGGSPRHDRIGTSVYSLSSSIDGLLLEVVAVRAVESAWHAPRRRRGSTAEIEHVLRAIAPWAGTLNAEMVCDLGVSLVLRGPHVVAYTEQLLADLPAADREQDEDELIVSGMLPTGHQLRVHALVRADNTAAAQRARLAQREADRRNQAEQPE
jgi:hypothetical protein